MIRVGLTLLTALSLAACGSSSNTTAALPPANPPVMPPVTPPVTPTAAIGATSTQAASFMQAGAGQAFVAASGSTALDLVKTNGAALTRRATYDLTVNGVTYDLRPDAKNSATNTMNFHTASQGGDTVSLFLNEDVPNGTIINTQITDASGATTQFFGVIGALTDTAELPATASYSGLGEISVDKAGGAFDDAPNTTVSFDADFTAGTLSGQFDVTDTAGDNNGNFDIAGSTTLALTGTITGSEFTADVDYTNLIGITNGLNSVNAQPISGGFFGTAGINAVGAGLSVGSSTGTDDAVVYTRIQATQQ